jgi:hypothetical protein
MHPIFSLIPYLGLGSFQDFIGNFFAAMGGEAVQHNGGRVR